MYRWKDIRREAGVGRAVKRKTEAGKKCRIYMTIHKHLKRREKDAGNENG